MSEAKTLKGWRHDGGEFALLDVRDYGQCYKTPRLNSALLPSMRQSGKDVVVLDGRAISECRKMNIPGRRCCPNGEFIYRIGAIVPDPETTIVIDRASRTRSIIAARTLIDFSLTNRVFALESSTQDWFLEDLPLDRGSQRGFPPVSGGTDVAALRERGRVFTVKHGVPFVEEAELNRWLNDRRRTTYLLDVRTTGMTATRSRRGRIPRGKLTCSASLIGACDLYSARGKHEVTA